MTVACVIICTCMHNMLCDNAILKYKELFCVKIYRNCQPQFSWVVYELHKASQFRK